MILKISNDNRQAMVSLSIFLLLIVACEPPNSESIGNSISYVNLEIIGESPLQTIDSIETFKIEIQDLDNPVGIGFSYVLDNQLLYFDRIRGEVLEIDPETGRQKLIIRHGEGPNEIPKFQTFTHSDDKRIFLYGYTYFIYDNPLGEIK